MRWTQLLTVAWLVVAGGCANDDAAPGDVSRKNGQTGSAGYACEAAACQRQGAELLGWIESTETPTFVASHCREGTTGPADGESLPVRHCQCVEEDGTVHPLEATGFSQGGGSAFAAAAGAGNSGVGGASVVATTPCLAWGRGHLACVFPASAGESCEPSDPSSCEDLCARLQGGYEEDAARRYDVELRLSECRARQPGGDPAGGRCELVARINDACYASNSAGFFGPTPYDCSLSNDEILAARDGHSAGAGGAGGGSGP